MENCGFFTPINGVVITPLTTGRDPPCTPFLGGTWNDSQFDKAFGWFETRKQYIPRRPKPSKYLVRRCLEPLKAEPQEMFGGSNADPQMVFGRLGYYSPWLWVCYRLDVCFFFRVTYATLFSQIAWIHFKHIDLYITTNRKSIAVVLILYHGITMASTPD